jgi:hypothetical protein
LWVRFPPVLLKKWPVGLAASGRQPLELEGWVRFPYGLLDQVVELADTRRSERRALTGVGVRLSPWSLRSGLESGFQHGLISRSTPVRIRPPQLPAEYANRQSGQVESLVRVCGFESHLGYCNGPVVQRQRLLAHIQATMVRVHPGLPYLLAYQGLAVTEEDKPPLLQWVVSFPVPCCPTLTAPENAALRGLLHRKMQRPLSLMLLSRNRHPSLAGSVRRRCVRCCRSTRKRRAKGT